MNEFCWTNRLHRKELLDLSLQLRQAYNTIQQESYLYHDDPRYSIEDIDLLPNLLNPQLPVKRDISRHSIFENQQKYYEKNQIVYKFQYFFLSEIFQAWTNFVRIQRQIRHDEKITNLAISYRRNHLLSMTLNSWKYEISSEKIRKKNILRLYFLSWKSNYLHEKQLYQEKHFKGMKYLNSKLLKKYFKLLFYYSHVISQLYPKKYYSLRLLQESVNSWKEIILLNRFQIQWRDWLLRPLDIADDRSIFNNIQENKLSQLNSNSRISPATSHHRIQRNDCIPGLEDWQYVNKSKDNSKGNYTQSWRGNLVRKYLFQWQRSYRNRQRMKQGIYLMDHCYWKAKCRQVSYDEIRYVRSIARCAI